MPTIDAPRLPRPADDPAPDLDERDFWQAADSDDAARLRANHAATKALAAVMRLAEEIAEHITGDDYREAILNLEAQFTRDAAHLETTARDISLGINTSAFAHFDRMPAPVAEWAAAVCERMGEVEGLSRALTGRAMACPAEPGSVE